MTETALGSEQTLQLRRSLRFRDLVLYGIILIQPTAPMPVFGVLYQEARGHVTTTILLALLAMLLTAVSYGRMARAYPQGGSAFLYVSCQFNPTLGFLCGWCMTMDYVLNPLICTIWSARAAHAFVPGVAYAAFVVFFALLFTLFNLAGVETTARLNAVMTALLGLVIVVFLAAVGRWLLHGHALPAAAWLRPLFDRQTFSARSVLHGTSIAVLTYIGFDGISTLADESIYPRRDLPRAIVLTCVLAGLLATVEVFAAQLVLPRGYFFHDVETAFPQVGGLIGGAALFGLINGALLVATIGSGMASQMGAARLIFSMSRDRALPLRFFGSLSVRNRIPRNNVLLIGAICLVGGFGMSYEIGAELLNFGALIGFIFVNAAATHRAYIEGERHRTWLVLGSITGMLVCILLWFNLSWLALAAGTAWLIAGVMLHRWRVCHMPSKDAPSVGQVPTGLTAP